MKSGVFRVVVLGEMAPRGSNRSGFVESTDDPFAVEIARQHLPKAESIAAAIRQAQAALRRPQQAVPAVHQLVDQSCAAWPTAHVRCALGCGIHFGQGASAGWATRHGPGAMAARNLVMELGGRANRFTFMIRGRGGQFAGECRLRRRKIVSSMSSRGPVSNITAGEIGYARRRFRITAARPSRSRYGGCIGPCISPRSRHVVSDRP